MNPLMLELLPMVGQGYCCSQLLILLMLQARDQQNPDLVRAMQGLCHGIGQSDGPCGLLTGGALPWLWPRAKVRTTRRPIPCSRLCSMSTPPGFTSA
ncbi:MAG: C-GCAxxG-C-C family (seleno)protein [Desulfovibrio fairfieldensis]